MKKTFAMIVILSSTVAASAFAESTPVADTATKAELQQLSTKVAESNALLKKIVQQNEGRVSEQTQKACLYDGKLYGQGALVNNDTQICTMENDSPLLKPAPAKAN